MAAKRDYKAEYKKFQSSAKQKKLRAERNKLNRKAKREGRIKKGDGNVIAHVKGGGTKVKTRSANAGSKTDMPGDVKARGKGQTKNQPKRKARKVKRKARKVKRKAKK
jgi:hypothetical protein